MSKSRPVTIQSYRNAANEIKFRMLESGVETEILVFNKTTDKIKKSDDYDIDFTLVNGTGCDVEFVTNQNKPGEPVMYLAQGSATYCPPCPDGPSATPIKDFTAGNPTSNTLTVKNKDSDSCFYKFVLRFVDKSTGIIVPFDPIYGNQDGGRSFTGNSALTVGFLSGAAGGAAAMGLNASSTAMSAFVASAIGAVIGVIVGFVVDRLGGPTL